MTRTCSTLPSGATVLTTRTSDNCMQPLMIDVTRLAVRGVTFRGE